MQLVESLWRIDHLAENQPPLISVSVGPNMMNMAGLNVLILA